MKHLPVGIQVYGLRDLIENDPGNFKHVMKQVKEMGYDGVELAGLYGLSPETVHNVLDEVGLIPISAHVPLAEMMEDAEKTAADYKVIGVSYVVVPYLPEEYRHNTPGYETAVKEMTRIGQIMKTNGLKLLYHNHDFEFVRLANGVYGLDDIYTRIPADTLMAEPDTCWIKVAGENPAEYIKKYGPRCEIVHLKDFIKEGNPKNLYQLIGTEVKEETEESGRFEFRPVGFGMQVWDAILDASLEAGSKWVVVEQDEHYDLNPLEAARRSREYLRIIGW